MALQVGHLHPLPHSSGVIMSSRRIGNYQVTDYVGSGGFGSVFKAEDINTPGRVVAIKELHKKYTNAARCLPAALSPYSRRFWTRLATRITMGSFIAT